MKLFKKYFVMLLTVLAVLTAAVGCGGELGGEEDDIPVGATKLVVWTVAPLVADYKNILRGDATNKQALFTKSVVESFEAANENVSLVLRNKGWGDALNKELGLAISGNTMPDITVGEQYVPVYVANNHFEELNLGQELIDDLLPQAKGTGMKDGKLYAAPVWSGSFGLSINKKVLRESKILGENDVPAQKYTNLGINPLNPNTWEDLLLVSQDIRAYYTDTAQGNDENKGAMLLSNTVEGSAWRALAYMRTAGGDFVNENGVINMDTPENAKAFQMMRDLNATAPKGAINAANEDAIWELFFNSKAAYIVDGIDTITRTVNYNFEEGDVISVALPTFQQNGVKSNVLVGSGYYSISKTSKNKELALKFIKHLLSENVQLGMLQEDMRVPARVSVLEGDAIKQLSNYAKMTPYLIPFTDSEYSFNGAIPSFIDNPVQIWEKWVSFSKKLLTTTDNLSAILTAAHNEMLEAQNRT